MPSRISLPLPPRISSLPEGCCAVAFHNRCKQSVANLRVKPFNHLGRNRRRVGCIARVADNNVIAFAAAKSVVSPAAQEDVIAPLRPRLGR